MRVSPVAFLYRGRSREEALALSDRVTEITHDHPEGIRGARSVTEAIWLALQAEGAETVRREIANRYGYDLKRSVEDEHDIQTKVMTTLFALFAEVERDLISERTREGLARARSSGTKLGRPKGSLGVSRLDGKEDDIRHFLNLGVSKSAIAKITGVSRPTLYNFISTRGLKPSR